MTEAIVVAIVGGLCSLCGSFVGAIALHSKTVYRIEQLEKKVDKHNQVIDRTYKLESITALLDQRIDTLERKEQYQ